MTHFYRMFWARLGFAALFVLGAAAAHSFNPHA